MSKKKLVFGVGINDVDYQTHVTKTVGGVCVFEWRCPYYSKWSGILERCYSPAWIAEKPTYAGCSMCDSWVRLSDFIKWVDSQPNRDWEDCQPDKDLLFLNNKFYGPDTVVFISKALNTFLTDSRKVRGLYPIGVTYHKHHKKFQSQCQNPFAVKKHDGRCVGYFNTAIEAHKAWQAKKHEYACQLAELQEDSRVADALRQRYAPDKDWTKA
jgi:hypothetical protein